MLVCDLIFYEQIVMKIVLLILCKILRCKSVFYNIMFLVAVFYLNPFLLLFFAVVFFTLPMVHRYSIGMAGMLLGHSRDIGNVLHFEVSRYDSVLLLWLPVY